MTTFTNKSTIEKIDNNLINSDFGVLMFRSASFNKFDITKYQNKDGTPNDLAVQKIYECLKNKHRSVFYGSRLTVFSEHKIDINLLSKNEILGLEYTKTSEPKGFMYNMSVFLVMYWIKAKPKYLPMPFSEHLALDFAREYPACYKALQMLRYTIISKEEQELLNNSRTATLSFKAQLPIFIARQFYRHRGINFTERSGRYTAENTRFYKPDNWRKAPEKATQGSIENRFAEEWLTSNDMSYKNILELQNEWFQSNINKKEECGDLGNIGKEQARTILSQSQITTTINTVNLCTLSSVLSQRLDEHAQLEIREVAKQLYDIACEEFGKELVDKLIDIENRLIF